MNTFTERVRRRWRAERWSRISKSGRTVTVRTKQGVFCLSTKDNVISRLLFIEGHYQLDLVDRSMDLLSQKSLIPARGEGVLLDVGANNGVISIGALLANRVAAAIGLEPDPENFALLQRNIEANDLSHRFEALPFAASNVTAKLHFELSPDNHGDHRIRPSASGVEEEGAQHEEDRSVIQVDARPLDDILSSLPGKQRKPITLVWMDVQGHEGHVLGGGEKLFSTGVPLVTEVWPYGIHRSGGSVEAFCSLAHKYWPYFWAWSEDSGHVRRKTSDLAGFCVGLGNHLRGVDDLIFSCE